MAEKTNPAARRVSFGERAQFLLVGVVIALVLGLGLRAVVSPILGREMGRSLGMGLSAAIVILFSDGYPRATLRQTAALFGVMLAVGLVAGWLGIG
jgi:hypothetical protein